MFFEECLMRRVCFIPGLVALILMGCFSTQPVTHQKGQQSRPRITLLTPDDILDKPLSGSDKDGDFSFLFKQDGTLEYMVNDTVNVGTWEYDGSSKIMRYKLDWTENGNPNGYGADIAIMNGEVIINAHWYLTDAYITMFKKVTLPE
jgi:hypothetical protein